MMSLLIFLASLVAYFVIGAWYAKTQTLACYKRAQSWTCDDSIRGSVKAQMFWRLVFWPWGMLFDACRGSVDRWFLGAVDQRKARVQQLEADARSWEAKRYGGTEAERQMARELSRLCRQQADELRL